MKELILQAPAKLNLTLEILHKRDDGYHELKSLMTTVGIFDTIRMRRADVPCVNFSCDGIDTQNNTVMRAIQLYAKAANIREYADVYVEKRIPSEAGMGGGSADAAAVLWGLQSFYGALDEETLYDVGRRVGADVPFCMKGGVALCEGIGEKLTSVAAMPMWFVVLKGEKGVSTKELFSRIRSVDNGEMTDKAILSLQTQNANINLAKALYNGMMPPAMEILPEIQSNVKVLYEQGAIGASMTGSGSAVFGMFVCESDARAAHDKLKKTAVFCETCKGPV